MNTRFEGTYWITGNGEALTPAQMDTGHLMNTLKMLLRRPTMVISMMIRDVEAFGATNANVPWTLNGSTSALKQSIRNITSMSPGEICDYVLGSPLGQEMQAALISRGVNVQNYIQIATTTEN